MIGSLVTLQLHILKHSAAYYFILFSAATRDLSGQLIVIIHTFVRGFPLVDRPMGLVPISAFPQEGVHVPENRLERDW